MPYTDNFRRQHQEILAIVTDINERRVPDQIKKDPRSLRMLLSSLAGRLNIHLAMEDKSLYPRLIEVNVENSKSLATAFKTEMGDLAQGFSAYNQRWHAAAIGSDPEGFARETRAVFTALAKRIARENTQLYPLTDRIV